MNAVQRRVMDFIDAYAMKVGEGFSRWVRVADIPTKATYEVIQSLVDAGLLEKRGGDVRRANIPPGYYDKMPGMKSKAVEFPAKADVRGDVKQILMSAHGATPSTATKQQVSNSARQYFDSLAGHFQDRRIAFRDYIIACVKDWLDGAKSKAVVAVDVHQTLMADHGPSVTGPEVPGAKEAMQAIKDAGHDIAIWTVGDSAGIKAWLDERKIPYDWINESPLTPDDTDSPKIRADCYVDDKNIEFDGDWDKTTTEVIEWLDDKEEKRREWEASKQKSFNRSGAMANIGFVMGTGRANRDTEEAVFAAVGVEDDSAAFSRAVKAASDEKLKEILRIIDRHQPGALPAGAAMMMKRLCIIPKGLDREERLARLKVMKGPGGRSSEFLRWGGLAASIIGLATGNPIPALMAAGSVGYDWLVRRFNDGYTPEQLAQALERKSKSGEIAKAIVSNRQIASGLYQVVNDLGEKFIVYKVGIEDKDPGAARHHWNVSIQNGSSPYHRDAPFDSASTLNEALRYVEAARGTLTESERARQKSLDDGEDKGAIADAGAWLARKWESLENRYGRKAALAMAVAGLTTFPIPGNITAIIGAAEAIRGIHGYMTRAKSDPCFWQALRELSAEEIEKMVSKAVKEIDVEKGWDIIGAESGWDIARRPHPLKQGYYMYDAVKDGERDGRIQPAESVETLKQRIREKVRMTGGKSKAKQAIHSRSVRHPVRKKLGRMIGEYDEEKNEADFVVSTAAPDRDGDTVEQESLDFSSFDVNPVGMLVHNTDKIPIGRWLPETREIITVVDPESGQEVKATKMRLRFNMHTAEGRETAGSVKDDFLTSASVSFLPVDGGTDKNQSGGSHYKRAKVTEISVCAVPANQGAARAVEMVLKSFKARHKGRDLPDGGHIYEVGDKIKNAYTGQEGEVTRGGGPTGKVGVRWDDGKETLTPVANVRENSKSVTASLLCKDCGREVGPEHKAETGHDVEEVAVADDKDYHAPQTGIVTIVVPARHAGDERDRTRLLASLRSAGATITESGGDIKAVGDGNVLRRALANNALDLSDYAKSARRKAFVCQQCGSDRIGLDGICEQCGSDRVAEEDRLKSKTNKVRKGVTTVKYWTKGRSARILRKSLGLIVKDANGAMTEEEQMQLARAKLKADELEVLDEEADAPDLVEWAEQELEEPEHKALGTCSICGRLGDVNSESICSNCAGKAKDGANDETPPNDREEPKANGVDYVRWKCYENDEYMGEVRARTKEEAIKTAAKNWGVRESDVSVVEAGKSKSELNDDAPPNDEAPRSSEPAAGFAADVDYAEVVELAEEMDGDAALAYKVLKALKRKSKVKPQAKRFKVRVGKRWVRKAVGDVVNVEGVGRCVVVAEKPGGWIRVKLPSGREMDVPPGRYALTKTELVDEPAATALSKQEAEAVAEETGGDVVEQSKQVEVFGKYAVCSGDEIGEDRGKWFIVTHPAGDYVDGSYGSKQEAIADLKANYTKSKTETDDPAPMQSPSAEALAAKAEELVEAGVEEDEAPALAFKVLKKQLQLKQQQRSKAMDDDEPGPAGLRAIKGWVKQMEDDMAQMHKAEQGDVMEAGAKAVKLLKSCMAKAYDETDEVDKDEALCPECQEEPCVCEEVVAAKGKRRKAIRIGECPLCEAQWGPSDEDYARENGKCPECEGSISGSALEKSRKRFAASKSLSKSERDIAKNTKDVLEEMSKAGGVPGVLRSALAHAALKLHKAAGLDEPDPEEGKRKSLSKQQRDAIEEVLATLKSAAESQDTPKHLKSALNHEAAQLESLSAAKRKQEFIDEAGDGLEDDEPLIAGLPSEAEEQLSKALNTIAAGYDRMQTMDKKLFSVAGRNYRNGDE